MLVEQYLNLTQLDRQKHLDLLSPCVERGGNSTNHRGVLAQYLDTPIYGKPADLCHACHNGACSNPKHLYWGSRKENIQDSANNGTWKTPWERTVEKHGYEKACELNRRGDKTLGGKGNKGKPKSEDHKRKISEGVKKKFLRKTG
jgi:hypothetical protein